MSRFYWEGLRIRYNTQDGEPPTGLSYDEDSVTIADLLAVRGFSRENGEILGCTFEQDKSLPRGMMVVEPLGIEKPADLPIET